MLVKDFDTAALLADAVNGAVARGRITVPLPEHLTDGQTVTVEDGTNPATVLEMDVAGDGVGGGNVQVDTSAIADGRKDLLATALETAINAIVGGLTVTATAEGDKLLLEADAADDTHNVALTQSSAPVQFELEGMSGGFNSIPQANISEINHVRGRWYLHHA